MRAPVPLAGNAVTATRDQAAAPGTRAPAQVISGHAPRKTRALLPRRAALRAETRSDRLRRIAGLLERGPKTRASHYDPLFERPDLIENDYYRLRNQPHSW